MNKQEAIEFSHRFDLRLKTVVVMENGQTVNRVSFVKPTVQPHVPAFSNARQKKAATKKAAEAAVTK